MTAVDEMFYDKKVYRAAKRDGVAWRSMVWRCAAVAALAGVAVAVRFAGLRARG